MRYLLYIVLVFNVWMQADQIKMKSLACPSLEIFEKIPPEALQDELALSLYAMANNCRILSRRDSVTAIGYDPRNDKNIFIQIVHNESGETLYIRRKNIEVEQPGKNNQFRF